MNTSGSNRESGRGLRLICQASAIFFLQFATSGASAQDWTFIPQLGAGAEADDNASLSTRTDEEVELNGWLGDARLEVAYTSPGTVFSIEPRLRWLRYPDNEEFDSDDQFADLFFTHQGRYNRFRVTGGYARESIRTGERDDVDLDVEDPDDNTDNNTGIVQQGRRERIRLRPTWEYRFSEFSRLITRVDFTNVDYESELVLGGLDNYTDTRLRLSYERDLSERNTLILLGTGRTYNTAGSDKDTNSYGGSVGFGRRLSPSTRIQALVGIEAIDEVGVDADPTYTADLSIVRRLEVITLVAQYRRSIAGSGQGELTARDSINLRFTRDLSDRIRAGLGVRAYRTEAIEGVSSELNERDYVQLRALFDFNITQTFWTELDYRYTFIRRTTFGESANSNNVNLWFRWRPQPRLRNRN